LDDKIICLVDSQKLPANYYARISKMSKDLKILLQKIDDLLSANDKKTLNSLRPGIDPNKISTAINQLAVKLPIEIMNAIIDWYSWHDGQESSYSLYPNGWRLMSIQECLEIWKELTSPYFDGLPFKRCWLPLIARDSDYLALDLSEEQPGVILAYYHDSKEVEVDYASIQEWAEKAITALKLRGKSKEIKFQCERPQKWGRINTTVPFETDALPIGSLLLMHLVRVSGKHLDWQLFVKIEHTEWLGASGFTLPEAFQELTNPSWERLKSKSDVQHSTRLFFLEFNELFKENKPKNPKIGAFVGFAKIANAEEVILELKKKRELYLAEI
jgi:hypothetical protein